MANERSEALFSRRLLIAAGLASLATAGTARPKRRRTHAITAGGVDTVKLIRPRMNVTLKLTAGGLAQYGTWIRDGGASNSRLQWDSGVWENWVLGSPGGGTAVRIYAPDKTKFLWLKDYTSDNSEGDADFLLPDSGGDFGSDPAKWFRI
jgi:hypothetical protein